MTRAPLFLLLLLLAACSVDTRELKERLAERERNITTLEAQRDELLTKTRELERLLGECQPPASDPCDARLSQLRATLNKAYLDIKIALVERDEYKQKLTSLQRKHNTP